MLDLAPTQVKAPAVAATLVLAVALGWRAVRRISRQVVVPLVELGRATAAMPEAGGAGHLDLGPSAAAELRSRTPRVKPMSMPRTLASTICPNSVRSTR